MDSAIFMERYGYRILLGVAILVLLGVIAAASTTIYNLFKGVRRLHGTHPPDRDNPLRPVQQRKN